MVPSCTTHLLSLTMLSPTEESFMKYISYFSEYSFSLKQFLSGESYFAFIFHSEIRHNMPKNLNPKD